LQIAAAISAFIVLDTTVKAEVSVTEVIERQLRIEDGEILPDVYADPRTAPARGFDRTLPGFEPHFAGR